MPNVAQLSSSAPSRGSPILARRLRWAPWVTTLAVFVFLWAACRWLDLRLGRPDFLSGYVLAGLTTSMFLLPLRKKLLVLPLGRVAHWQKLHQYVGTLACLVFVLHAGWPIHGTLEICLASLFLLHALSGFALWYLNTTTPRKLSIFGQEILANEIPRARQQVLEQAHQVAMQAAGRVESHVLAEFYMQRLAKFFQLRRSLVYTFFPNGRLRRYFLDALKQQDRYLDVSGRELRERLCELVQEKDDLDFRDALHKRLQWWNISHSGMTALFVLLMVTHIWLAHRFHGT